MIRKLVRWAVGYAEISCVGDAARFLSAAMKTPLRVFDVRSQNGGTRLCAFAKDYLALSRLARANGARLRAISKRGAAFKLKRMKLKLPLAVGVCVFSLTLLLLGELVFTIEIKGSSLIGAAELRKSLSEHGLSVGMRQSAVDVDNVVQSVLLDNSGLSWMSVNLTYGKATVEVRDKTTGGESGVGRYNMKIVASRDAQIKRLDVTSGVCLVKPGEVVTAGQDLVIPEELPAKTSWAAAVKAEITAYTVRTTSLALPADYEYRFFTGETEARKSFAVGKLVIPLSIGAVRFDDYETLSYSVPVTIYGVVTPARLLCDEHSEVIRERVRLDERAARELLDEMLREYEEKTLLRCRILHRETELFRDEKGFRLDVSYLCEEDIGNYIYFQ